MKIKCALLAAGLVVSTSAWSENDIPGFRGDLYQKHSYCAGFTQAIAINKFGGLDNIAAFYLRGTFSDASLAALNEFNKHKQAAANLQGGVETESFDLGGREAGDIIMTGNIHSKAVGIIAACRTLPFPASRGEFNNLPGSLVLGTHANYCVKVLEEYSYDRAEGSEKQFLLEEAMKLRAWLVDTHNFSQEQVNIGLKEFGTPVYDLDAYELRDQFVRTKNSCVQMIKNSETR